MLVTKLSTSFQQICQDVLFSGSPYITLFTFGAIRCASGNAIHISPEVIEFGTVGILYTCLCQLMRSPMRIKTPRLDKKNIG